MPFNLCSNVVYIYSCGWYNATYYCKTCQRLNVRVGEHSDISPLTGKKLEAKTTAAIKDHMWSHSFTQGLKGLQNFGKY